MSSLPSRNQDLETQPRSEKVRGTFGRRGVERNDLVNSQTKTRYKSPILPLGDADGASFRWCDNEQMIPYGLLLNTVTAEKSSEPTSISMVVKSMGAMSQLPEMVHLQS